MPRSPDLHRRKLRSSAASERLEAARYFAEHATKDDERLLREAVSRESVLWIRNALRRAIARVSPAPEQEQSLIAAEPPELPKGYAEQVFAEALETTSAQLLHEVEPLLGSLRLAAASEITDFKKSNTSRSLDRLDEFLAALSRLRRAASAPKMEEIALDELIFQIVKEIQSPEGVQIRKTGPIPCIVDGDRSLIAISLSNGLRNAIEATVATGADLSERPITVAWSTTDVDCWVSIVDTGIGFKGNLQNAFRIGSTTKERHLGMGLAITAQAMRSMEGDVRLVPNDHGTRFEIRWPRKAE